MEQYLPLPYMERHCNARGEFTFENITVLQKIFNDTAKCNQYATINNDIKDAISDEEDEISLIQGAKRDLNGSGSNPSNNSDTSNLLINK